ncbi:helix-turn-helix domain-containing protein [Amycolatopsis sp. NPDC051102]|uniref:winged helix-turn-helix transcriptional regulator n=1 Tax=Amycolatopsis sp. NPDC051102 TaxID=3155163 RepID=UPI00341A00FF
MTTPLPGHPVGGSTTGRPIMALLDLLGRRWTLRILWELRDDVTLTFRALQQRCDGVSSSVLATRLRELGEADLVGHAEGYSLTGQGRSLFGTLVQLDAWAADWRPRQPS